MQYIRDLQAVESVGKDYGKLEVRYALSQAPIICCSRSIISLGMLMRL